AVPTHRGRLRPVAAPTPRLARFPFLLVLIGIFGLGMAGLLMLNTTLQNQAFQARSLNRQATELTYVQADLENRLDSYAAPAELARLASKAGMRPNPHPVFLVLPEGKIVGKPTRVSGHEVPSLVIKTPEQLAAEKAKKVAKAKAAAAAKKAADEAKRAAAERAAAEQQATAAAEKKNKKKKPANTAVQDNR
ncbi:MAG TPA: hypothetical protein VNT24_06135, partial [Propionibacteriaceae bacterium]|nr:hypothetical protein [Propionibacteriaceae bacterium]